MILLAKNRSRSHRLRIDTLNEEKRHLAKLDRLHLDELLNVDLLVQSQLSLLVDLSQGAVDEVCLQGDGSLNKWNCSVM